MAGSGGAVEVDAGGRPVRVSNPDKIFFPAIGLTKLGLVEYYLAVADGALRGVRERPTVLKRYPNGVEAEPFFQKRLPPTRPPWIESVRVSFPSGRHADELCPTEIAHVIWAVNLGCVDLNPWPVRRRDVDHPDELRVDLDPQPGVPFEAVRRVALETRRVLGDHGLTGVPKTSGSRGLHVNVPIDPRWSFTEVRTAALALAREVERRRPDVATSAWWKEERGQRVLLDYNQNARDRTVASAYSVRPVPDARVSCPLTWEEVPDAELGAFTVATVPARYRAIGDPASELEGRRGDLTALLELAERDRAEGLGDAPWPPHFAKGAEEPRRVAPSRRRQD